MQSEQFLQNMEEKISECDTSEEAAKLRTELSVYLTVTQTEQTDRVSKVSTISVLSLSVSVYLSGCLSLSPLSLSSLSLSSLSLSLSLSLFLHRSKVHLT